MKANYHTHTKRCGHAFGEDSEFVEAAIEAGLEILGFADHGPWVYKNNYRSGIRLTPAEVDAYFYSLENLRREYKKDIQNIQFYNVASFPTRNMHKKSIDNIKSV